MKTHRSGILVVAFATIGVVGPVSAAMSNVATIYNLSPESESWLIPVITSDQFLVTGEVSARTDTDFTVLNPPTSQTTTIQVSDDTVIVRGAETIHLSDLKVGDKVTVTVFREANGRLVANKVTVRLAEEES